MQPHLNLPSLTLVLLGACSADARHRDAQYRAGERDGSAASEQEPRTAWDYLRQKYDADGDGEVTRLEYDRAGADFATQDHDGDGVLTGLDFDIENMLVRFERALRAQYMLLEYMQDDAEPMQLTDAEWQRAARLYDTNGDELIEKQEFKSLYRSRRRRLIAPEWRENPPEAELQAPWYELLMGVDANGDGALGFPEIEDFFHANDNGRGVWNVERYLELPVPPGFVSLSGPRLGTPAPDFTLAGIDGGAPVTLSSFAGETPVALIFGSYT